MVGGISTPCVTSGGYWARWVVWARGLLVSDVIGLGVGLIYGPPVCSFHVQCTPVHLTCGYSLYELDKKFIIKSLE